MFAKKGSATVALCLWTASAFAIQDSRIVPPDVQLVDNFGVNLATGHVTVTVDTVSIGGDLGLAHSITAESNHFGHSGSFGYLDKYANSVRYVDMGKGLFVGGETQINYASVLRVFGPVGSQDFMVMVDGVYSPAAQQVTSGFTYRALGDTRHTLEVSADGGQLIWTTDDGTVLEYQRRKDGTATSGGSLERVIYPNGFTITTFPVSGVTTNTGFQLKYDYEANGELAPEKQALYSQLPSGNQVPRPDGWARNPKHIWGVNNAYQYCSTDHKTDCDLEGRWPRATFHWPGGMPRAFYLGKSVFKVTDADGGVTELHYEAQDVSLQNLNDPNSSNDVIWKKGEKWSPRLVGIKSAHSEIIDRKYTYRNNGDMKSQTSNQLGTYTYWQLDSVVGEVQRAETPNGVGGYNIPSATNSGGKDYARSNGGHGLLNRVIMYGNWPGKVQQVDTARGGIYFFDADFRNFLTRSVSPNGLQKRYSYTRGNLVKVVEQSRGEERVALEAAYPADCKNKKTCNKPLWVKDRGSRTDYTYHAPSGQVQTVTGPPDANGVRPQTRYTYSQLYAYYKKNSESIVRADTPVWLLTREAHCRTTAATSNGCAGGTSDEVVTHYDYGPQQAGTPNNLFLRGVSVTAAGSDGLETRTTCYQYDRFGNRIGETRPKGNVDAASCR